MRNIAIRTARDGNSGLLDNRPGRRQAVLLKHVDLDDPDTSSTVFTLKNCGISSRREIRDEDGGFGIVRWRQTGGLDLCLVRFPIVVRVDGLAVGIAEFKDGIAQSVGDAKGGQRWADATDNDISRSAATKDKPADHHVVAGLDESASADVCEGRSLVGIEVVSFDHCDSGAVVSAVNHSRVGARIQGNEDGRFRIVRRSDRARDEVDALAGGKKTADLCGPPVVIRGNRRAGSIMQFQHWIG